MFLQTVRIVTNGDSHTTAFESEALVVSLELLQGCFNNLPALLHLALLRRLRAC